MVLHSQNKKVGESGQIESKYTQGSIVDFVSGDSEPIFNTHFSDFKEGIMKKLGSSNKLEINGLYGSNETNNSSFDNLGLSRAVTVQNHFGDLEESRVNLTSKQIDKIETVKSKVRFRVITNNNFVEETEYGAVIKESVLMEKDTVSVELDAFLTFLSIEKSNDRIDIIGHWDNTVTEGIASEKGLEAANNIMDMLIARGIPAKNLNATSKGSTSPTADGVSKRVEIKYEKKN